MRDMNLSAKIEIELHRRLSAVEGGGATPFDAAYTGLAPAPEGSQAAAGAAEGGAAGGAAAALASGARTPGTPPSMALSYDSEDEEREVRRVSGTCRSRAAAWLARSFALSECPQQERRHRCAGMPGKAFCCCGVLRCLPRISQWLASSRPQAIDVVEDLLEAYFMSIDNTWNKLQTLCE